jgi:hypothetical protein
MKDLDITTKPLMHFTNYGLGGETFFLLIFRCFIYDIL